MIELKICELLFLSGHLQANGRNFAADNQIV